MTVKKIPGVAACAVCAAMMSGCLMTNMGTLQEATFPIQKGEYTVLGDRVQAVDDMWIFPFGISDGRPGSPALRALDKAKAKVEGTEGLIEVSQSVETYVYPLLFIPVMNVKTRVTGIPVKSK